jgi:hypothetical protein
MKLDKPYTQYVGKWIYVPEGLRVKYFLITFISTSDKHVRYNTIIRKELGNFFMDVIGFHSERSNFEYYEPTEKDLRMAIKAII